MSHRLLFSRFAEQFLRLVLSEISRISRKGKIISRSIDINLENDFIKFLGQSGSAKESKLEATDIELMVERVEYLYARRENVPASNWGK